MALDRDPVLSAADLEAFDGNGMTVVRQAVPVDLCERIIDDIWAFVEAHGDARREDRSSWYQAPLQPLGFVDMFHSAALWEMRSLPRVYNAFADLFVHAGESDHLWCSIDRVGVKLPPDPSHPDFAHRGFTHWDYDITAPDRPFQLQGAVALRDTDESMGGFHCARGSHANAAAWAPEVPRASVERFYADQYPVEVPAALRACVGPHDAPVPMRAGDLVIWRGETAHGNGENRSRDPRYAAYVTMVQADQDDFAHVAERLRVFESGVPGGQPYPQLLPGMKASGNYSKPIARNAAAVDTSGIELSELGERLLGASRWE